MTSAIYRTLIIGYGSTMAFVHIEEGGCSGLFFGCL
jgi:hypothetical protein